MGKAAKMQRSKKARSQWVIPNESKKFLTKSRSNHINHNHPDLVTIE